MASLAGSWSGPILCGKFEAHYAEPTATGSLSYSTLTCDGEQAFYEFEVFRVEGDEFSVQPHPMGQPEMVFAFVPEASSALRWVFENPANDFPTRITYDRSEADRLTITLTDPHRGSEKVETFALVRSTEHTPQP